VGADHPATSYSLSNLALLYRHQGKYEQARSLYQRALKIRQQTLGPEHPRVAQTLSNIAQTLTLQGRYEEAEPLSQQALAIFEQTLGHEHPDTIATQKAHTEQQHLTHHATQAAQQEDPV
jgi:tetratricopeptide (TPR) repeat protein